MTVTVRCLAPCAVSGSSRLRRERIESAVSSWVLMPVARALSGVRPFSDFAAGTSRQTLSRSVHPYGPDDLRVRGVVANRPNRDNSPKAWSSRARGGGINGSTVPMIRAPGPHARGGGSPLRPAESPSGTGSLAGPFPGFLPEHHAPLVHHGTTSSPPAFCERAGRDPCPSSAQTRGRDAPPGCGD